MLARGACHERSERLGSQTHTITHFYRVHHYTHSFPGTLERVWSMGRPPTNGPGDGLPPAIRDLPVTTGRGLGGALFTFARYTGMRANLVAKVLHEQIGIAIEHGHQNLLLSKTGIAVATAVERSATTLESTAAYNTELYFLSSTLLAQRRASRAHTRTPIYTSILSSPCPLLFATSQKHVNKSPFTAKR